MAVVHVEPPSTDPTVGASEIARAQQVFPTLPILLLAPRGDEDPLAYATFDFEPLLPYIDPEDIEWSIFAPEVKDTPLPF